MLLDSTSNVAVNAQDVTVLWSEGMVRESAAAAKDFFGVLVVTALLQRDAIGEVRFVGSEACLQRGRVQLRADGKHGGHVNELWSKAM